MPIQYVNTGSSPNKGDGDSLRSAFTKINYNFGQLITLLGSTGTDVTTIASNETIRLLSHNQHSGVVVQYNAGLDKITVTTLPPFDQELNTTDSPTFNNLAVTNTATFGGDIDVGGTIKVGIVQGYDDFTIIKEDPDGLHLRLRNTVDYGASSIELVNSYYGGLVVLHQNPIQSGDYLPNSNYIYGMLPNNTLNIGRYSDINFYADAAAFGNTGAMLTATASMSIISTTGNVLVNKTLTVAETTATATINFGTDQYNGKIQREHVAQVGYIFTFPANYSGSTSALTGGDYVYLPVNAESTLVQPGWTLTFAGGHQELVESVEYIDFGGGIEVQAIRWLAGLDLPAQEVWPIVATSADYEEVIRQIVITPDLQVPSVNWEFARKGALVFPDGTEQTTAYTGGIAGTSTFYTVRVTSTETTTLPTTGALVVAGGVGIGEDLHVGGVGHFGLEPNILLENPLAVLTGNADGYVQVQIQNISTGSSASTDFIATSDIGNDTDNYIDIGINGSNYDSAEWTISGPNDGYLYVNGGSVTVGTDTPGETVTIHIGGTVEASKVAVFRESGSTGNSPTDGAFVVYGDMGVNGRAHVRDVLNIGVTSNLVLENPLIKAGADIDGYVQVHIQNQSDGESASSDFIATTDDGSDTEHYIDLGINNSQFSSVDWTMSGPHDGYLYVNDGNLTVGTDTPGKQLKINIGGVLEENLVAIFDSTGLMPAADLTYDLGSTSSQWRSIHVGTGTIYIGGVALGVSENNYVTVDGNPIITVSTSGTLTVQGNTNIVLGNVVVSDTAPAATTEGSQWYNTVDGRTYIVWNGVWVDANPTQIPSPETYLDGLAIDGTIISTGNVDSDAIVVDGGNNTKLTVSNNSVTIQVPGSEIRPYWAAEFGGITTAVTTSSAAFGTGAFYDSLGNVYVLGAVNYGDGGPGAIDSLLLKYDTNGNLLWSKTWHDDSGANCGAVNQAFAIDSNDRIYWLATAAVQGFGCWSGYMDTDGNLGLGGMAQNSLGHVDGHLDASDIACDNSGNYYLAGSYYNDISYSTTPVVIKIDGDSGTPIWTGNIIPEDFEDLPVDGQYRAVTVNPTSGDVWAIGDYDDGGLRAILSKWDVNGVHQWTKELVTTTGDLASAVIYNGGYVYTIVNDDPDAKAVISKFDTDGVMIWASFLAVGTLDPITNGDPFTNTGAYDLSFDTSGNVYVTGTIPGPPAGQPQLWITKLNPADGEMVYSRALLTAQGSAIFDYSYFGSSSGHRVGDIYEDKLVVTAITNSDIDDSTGTQALRVITAQLPIDGSVTGTFDNIDIVDVTSELDSISSTGTYTVTTLVWSTGTATTLISTSSISVSTVTDIVGLTGETIALGSVSGSSTTTNTWTFVNNNIILPPGGDILDSNGVSVLGATTSTTANGWQLTSSTSVVSLGSNGTLTLPNGGTIADDTGAIRLTPPGATSATQLLSIYPTVQDGNHIHLTADGGETDLYLGNDDQFVKIDHGGDIVVGTYSTATTSTWTFGTDGVLTFPSGNLSIGNALGSDSIVGNTDASVGVLAQGQYGTIGLQWIDNLSNIGSTSTQTQVAGVVVNNPLASTTGTVQIVTGFVSTASVAEHTWEFGTDGVLTLSTASTILGNNSDPNVYIETATAGTISTWTFAADGSLTLPDQGPILFGGNNCRIQALQAFSISSDGGIAVEVTDKQWVFGLEGGLTLPNGATIVDTTSTLVLTPNSPAQSTSLVLRSTYNSYMTADYPTDQGYQQYLHELDPVTYPDPYVSTGTEGTVISITLWDAGGLQYVQGDVEYIITGTGITAADFTPAVLTGTFAAANWTLDGGGFNYTNTNMLMIANDAIVEGEETFTVTIITTGTYAPGSGSNYLRVNIADGTTEGSESGHIHLISENMAQTSIFLGNDDKYVKVAADDQIYINVPNADTSGTSQLWTFGTDGSLTFPDATVQTTAYKSTSGSWTLATGSNTVSITVPLNSNYQMWVNGNIPNGIVEWNATVNVSNPNVPAIGSQYAWYYAAGNALVLTAIPNQIVGTAGVISTSSSYVGTTSNVFSFGITNNSTSTQTIYWGYTTL